MLEIKAPLITCEEILDKVIPHLPLRGKHTNFRKIIEYHKNEIVKEMHEYEMAAKSNRLGSLVDNKPYYPELSELDLKKLYTYLRDEEKSCYKQILYYNKLKKCPYCEKRIVTQLDHHLAQSKYELYCITPSNLVPICSDCNRMKRDSKTIVVHPYYDVTSLEKWMVCEIERVENEFAFNFRLDFTDIYLIKPAIQTKIKDTFNLLKINEYYQTEAACEFQDIIDNLIIIEKLGRNVLINEVMSYRSNCNLKNNSINGFKYAFYSGLLEYIDNVPSKSTCFI